MQFLKRNSKNYKYYYLTDKMNKRVVHDTDLNYASAHLAPHDAQQVSPNLRSG